MNKQFKEDSDFKKRVILFPVDLPEFHMVGYEGWLAWVAPLGLVKKLRGFEPREFLAKFWGNSPRLRSGDPLWLFDQYGSGIFPSRCSTLSDAGKIQLITAVGNEVLQNLGFLKAKHQEIVQSLPKNAQPWKKCPICSSIPDSSYGFWKGGVGGGVPVSETYLSIVGAPLFDDSTSHRHWCVKRCPFCGTYYYWGFDYEYLVNGTEDEVTLNRLSEEDAKKWIQKVEEVIQAAKADFAAKAPNHITVLMDAKDPKKIKTSTDYIYHVQLVEGQDISVAVPALVHALAVHPHTATMNELDCAGGWMRSVLRDYAGKSKTNAQSVFELLQNTTASSEGKEFAELERDVKKILTD